MPLDLKHQTPEQFASRYWAKVKAARQSGNNLEFCRLIWWLWARIQDGDFTNDQVRQSFNSAYDRSLSLAQWNTFVTNNLIPAKDKYLAIQNQDDL
jgi:hypothetical protein